MACAPRGQQAERKRRPQMKPTILVLAPYLTRREAGAAQATIHIINQIALQAREHLRVFTFAYEPDLIHGAAEMLQHEAPPVPRFLWRFPSAYVVRQTYNLLKRVRLPKADLCYSQNTALALAYRRLHPEVPVISHTGAILAHREYLEESSRPRLEAQIEARLARRLEASSYSAPNWRHIVSTRLVATQRAAHFRLPPDVFHVQPYGLDLSRFDRNRTYENMRSTFGVPADAFVAVTTARLISWKNIDLLLRALALSRHRHWLFVVGAGSEMETLRRLACALKIDERVRFVGHQNPAPFLACSDVFALPSRIESFGMVYAEAMSMGLPCIGRRNNPPEVLSSASDVIPEGTAGFCIDSAEELCDRLDRLALDEPLRRKMGAAAYEIATTQFTPARYVDTLRTIAADAGWLPSPDALRAADLADIVLRPSLPPPKSLSTRAQ